MRGMLTERTDRVTRRCSWRAARVLRRRRLRRRRQFKNEPRPPVPVQLTGVITDDEVTVATRAAAEQGSARAPVQPIILVISNQTEDPHTITLERQDGDGTDQADGRPINPLDTAQIQQIADARHLQGQGGLRARPSTARRDRAGDAHGSARSARRRRTSCCCPSGQRRALLGQARTAPGVGRRRQARPSPSAAATSRRSIVRAGARARCAAPSRSMIARRLGRSASSRP